MGVCVCVCVCARALVLNGIPALSWPVCLIGHWLQRVAPRASGGWLAASA